MKIVCDKCTTKYSIADEKVRGKVFKIRCKKCSHIIVVKGTDGAADGAVSDGGSDAEEGATVAGSMTAGAGAAAAGGAATGADRVWYMVVAGEQVGPFSAAEVRTKYLGGEADGETYAWREGFADWLRLSTIDDFRDLSSPSNDGGGETRRTDLNDMFAAQRAGQEEEDSAADLFGARRGAAAPQPAPALAAKPAASRGDDLFGVRTTAPVNGAKSPFGDTAEGARSRGGMSGGLASSGVVQSEDPKLTGQRNENSVLFSLNNLQALATSGAAPKQASPLPSTGGGLPAGRTGYASGANEGSGLIDIRAMAAATLSSVGPSNSMKDAPVEIPSFAAAPVFAPLVSAPIMIPTQQSSMPSWVWAVVGTGGVVVLAIIALIFSGGRKADVAPAPVAMNNPPVAPAPAPTAAQPPQPTAPVAAVAAAAVPAKAPEAVPAKAIDKEERAAARASRHEAKLAAKHEKAAGAAVAAAEPARAPVRAAALPDDPPKPARRSSGKDVDLDSLLDGGNARKRNVEAPREPAREVSDPSLPEQLDRGAIVGGMKPVQPKALQCFQQFHVPGIAMVHLIIGKAGRVTSVEVKGALAGTPTGDCVGKAVKSASFGRFNGSPMSIDYPFTLR